MATVEFWLSRTNPEDGSLRKYDPQTGREGAVVRFPNYVGIKSEDVVYDPRETVFKDGKEIPNKNKGQQTKIRLAYGEPSIFVDEQSDSDNIRLVKLAFTSGYNIFDETLEPQKAEYLRLTNTNQTPTYKGKPVKRFPNRQVIFFELNKAKIAKEEIDNDMRLAEALVMIKGFNADDLKDYGRVFGIDVDEVERDIAEVRRDLIAYAKMDVENFFDIVEDSVFVETQVAIYDAVEEGVLNNLNDGSFTWRSGGVIFKPAKAEDPVDGFTDYLMHTDEGKQVLIKIKSALSRGRKKAVEVKEESQSDIPNEQDKLLILDIIGSELIKYKIGKGFLYKEENLGKKKSDAVDNILNNKKLLEELKEAYSNLVV